MSTDNDIIEQLRQEIATRARMDADAIDPDAHFLFDLGMSSLDLLGVLAFAEKSFGTRFPDECLSDLATLNRVADAIHGHQQNKERDDQ